MEGDSYISDYGILNVTLSSDDWTNITFPVRGVKRFYIKEKTGTMEVDYRKSATETAEWRINIGAMLLCTRDQGSSNGGGQIRRVSASDTTVQIYYEY